VENHLKSKHKNVIQQTPVHKQECSFESAYDRAQMQYKIQHRTDPTIFPVILQTIITAHKMSVGGEWAKNMDDMVTMFGERVWINWLL